MASNKRVHSFTDDVLSDLDGVALAELIKRKEITSQEAVAASIARAQKVNPSLNAVVTDHYERGLDASKQPNEGFFSGVPIFFKDLTFFEGEKTYFGTEALANAKVSKVTDDIAKQILAQGFVHLGTSSMPEFGLGCTTEFPTMNATPNPWNIGHSVGGSSGGAGALVAAGVVPIAHSADGGGSTRIPASCCGLVGLKATRGRLLRSGLFKSQVVDVAIDGVITRTVRDTAHFYAEAEKYYKNPKVKPMGLVTGPSNQKFRIGYTADSVQGRGADATTKGVINDTIALLQSMGHEVKLIDLSSQERFPDDFINLWGMSAFYVKHFGKLMFGSHFDPKMLTKVTHGLAKHHLRNIFSTPFFVYRLRRSQHEYKKLMADNNIDIILTPTLAHAPPQLGYLGMDLEYDEMFPRMADWACFTPYANATGAPSISLPLGHDMVNDLPIGMMFGANHGEDALLLDLAFQLEEAQPWRKITA
jgi:amidase